MATEFARISGSYSTAFIGRYDVLSQNISGNYTTFRLYGIFYYGGGTSVGSSYSSFKVNGVEVKSGSYRYYPGDTQLGYTDINVYHNNDGSFPETWIGINASSYHINGSASGRIYAPTIPRQANVTSATDFTDETNPTIKYNNPGGFRINARLEFANMSGIIRRDNISNTGTYTFDLTEEERNLLRQKCTGNSMTVREVIATCIGGTAENYWSYQDKKMTIVNANPIFTDFRIEDINPITLELTGDNQAIIKGYSNVKATISNPAEALKYATMNKYRFTSGDLSTDISYSTSETSGILNKVMSGTFNVYAIDSRNNSTLVTRFADEISYNPLIKGTISIARQNGVSERTTLQFNGTIDEVNFGNITNSVKVCKYRYKTSSSEWSEYTDIIPTVSNNQFSFNNLILGDADEGFDIGNSYNIEVYVEDELSNVTFTATLGSGIPNIAIHKNGVGIMGKYDTNEGGDLQVRGKNPFKFSKEEKVIGIWTDGKPLYQKIIEQTTTSTNNRYDFSSYGINNVDTILIDYGHSYRKWGTEKNKKLQSANTWLNNSDYVSTYIDSDGYLTILQGHENTYYMIITLLYTKTND